MVLEFGMVADVAHTPFGPVVPRLVQRGHRLGTGALIDLIMLTLLGGKERTQAEWRTLLRERGFGLVGVTTGPATSLLEAAPA